MAETKKKVAEKEPKQEKAKEKIVKEKVEKEVKVAAKEVKKETKKEAKKENKKEVKEEQEVVKRDCATAKLINLSMTPRKVRLVIDLVRGKDLVEAYALLDNCPKIAALPVKKLIQSAEANAVNNFKMNADSLYIAEIRANDAMKLKRILPRAKGSASGLLKRWSNVYVTLKVREAR